MEVYLGASFFQKWTQDRFKGKWCIWELIAGSTGGEVRRRDGERKGGHKRCIFEAFTMASVSNACWETLEASMDHAPQSYPS